MIYTSQNQNIAEPSESSNFTKSKTYFDQYIFLYSSLQASPAV